MALIHQNNTSVYAGVSRQALDMRLPAYCEEMVNCYPTITNGIRRRNPTQLISNDIIVDSEQFVHTYDRGLSGESEEQYVITIDRTNGLRVFDVQANEYRTVTYSGNAARYLKNSNPEVGFSAITIKDTTFIANKDIVPLRVGELSTSINYAKLTYATTGYTKVLFKTSFALSLSELNIRYTNLSPARVKTYRRTVSTIPTTTYQYAISSVGATISVVVDGVTVKYTVKTKNTGLHIVPETLGETRSNIVSLLRTKLGSSYKVIVDTDDSINVYDLSGTALTVTTSITFPTNVVVNPPVISTYSNLGWSLIGQNNDGVNPISTITTSTTTEITQAVSDYDKKAFVWIKTVSPDSTFPYTFTLTLKELNGTTIGSTTSSVTTSSGVASALATWADGLADFTSTASGSVLRITRDSGSDFNVVISDTWGNQASRAFKGSVSQMEDLPKSFPFKDTILKIEGVQSLDNIAYWVKYDGNQWMEWKDPNMLSIVNDDTMPHILTRNADYTFTLSKYDWADIMVGDTDSQAIPEFFGDHIQDLFFVGGRLGILTRNGISLSQQGALNNFFRTTILRLLDDSPVTTYIDSGKSVGLKYAVELQGSIILFGDKLQFALDASKPISPSTISIQPISGFEINGNVKPISVGDSVYFLVSNNTYSSLYEMNKVTISSSIRANDVSAHVPNYIDNDIMQMAYSHKDGTIFLRSRTNRNRLYVYKHYGTEQEKVQMAWSVWTFDMVIDSIFVFDKELYIFGSRYDITVPLDEFSLVGVWDDSKFWLDETYWVDGEISASPSFEKMDIESYPVGASFKDIGTVRYTSEIELSEWVLSNSSGLKELRGSLLIKTAEISSEDNSEFSLIIEDKERGTTRNIPALYTVNRKPFISGSSKNMRIKIVSTNGYGFQINSISLEGQYNVRSKRV